MCWRAPNNTFAADLQNEDYRRSVLLKQAAIAIDAGVTFIDIEFDTAAKGSALLGDIASSLVSIDELLRDLASIVAFWLFRFDPSVDFSFYTDTPKISQRRFPS